MTERWFVRLPTSSASALSMLRGFAGVECAVDGEQLWLRGMSSDESLQTVLHALPGGQPFEQWEQDRLRPSGRIVPTERLPQLEWLPLTTVVQPTLAAPALAGRLSEKCPLRLVRSSNVESPNVLQTTLDQFAQYAVRAPHVRLQKCVFAACADGRVVVRGDPLPPLDGQLFVDRCGVAVPAGWRVEPALDSAVLADAFGLEAGDLCLLVDGDRVERIVADEFVRVTRSAVRLTVERLNRV
jgi:hypothetical protein